MTADAILVEDKRSNSELLSVHSINGFALTVPDLAVAADFYEKFGLATKARGASLDVSTGNEPIIHLTEGSRRRLHYLSFSAFSEDLPRFKRRLETDGITLLDPPSGLETNGLWFRDPDGNLVELRAQSRRSPQGKSAMETLVTLEGSRGAPDLNLRVAPRRLGHVLVFSTDVARSIAFYDRYLGFRVSDRFADIVAFLYSPHGSDHHLIAFAKSSRPGFHHASFEVNNVDSIGVGAMRMAAGGFREGWGFGRHHAGSNFFHYVRDPWGSFAEYFCDIDYIPRDCAWEPQNVPPDLSLYSWGPPVPTYFLENHES